MRHMKFEELNSHVSLICKPGHLQGWEKIHRAGLLCYNIVQY